jgi:hypothetical protein
MENRILPTPSVWHHTSFVLRMMIMSVLKINFLFKFIFPGSSWEFLFPFTKKVNSIRKYSCGNYFVLVGGIIMSAIIAFIDGFCAPFVDILIDDYPDNQDLFSCEKNTTCSLSNATTIWQCHFHIDNCTMEFLKKEECFLRVFFKRYQVNQNLNCNSLTFGSPLLLSRDLVNTFIKFDLFFYTLIYCRIATLAADLLYNLSQEIREFDSKKIKCNRMKFNGILHEYKEIKCYIKNTINPNVNILSGFIFLDLTLVNVVCIFDLLFWFSKAEFTTLKPGYFMRAIYHIILYSAMIFIIASKTRLTEKYSKKTIEFMRDWINCSNSPLGQERNISMDNSAQDNYNEIEDIKTNVLSL